MAGKRRLTKPPHSATGLGAAPAAGRTPRSQLGVAARPPAPARAGSGATGLGARGGGWARPAAAVVTMAERGPRSPTLQVRLSHGPGGRCGESGQEGPVPSAGPGWGRGDGLQTDSGGSQRKGGPARVWAGSRGAAREGCTSAAGGRGPWPAGREREPARRLVRLASASVRGLALGLLSLRLPAPGLGSAPLPAQTPTPPGRAGLPVEDPDKARSKKPKADYTTPEREVQEVSAVLKWPAKAASEHQEASASHAAPVAEQTQSTSSDPSSKRPAGSALEVEMLQIDPLPCGTNACLTKETLSLSHKTIPCLSASRKHHIKPVPDNILTLRPPIKERPGPESTPSEVSKMGRLFCAAEEDVQREEKEKYQQLLQLVKEKYPGSRPILQPTSFRNVQASSQEPVMPVDLESKEGVSFCLEDIRHTDVCSPRWAQRSDTTRYNSPAASSPLHGRAVKQAVAGGAETSAEGFHEFPQAPLVLHTHEEKPPRTSEKPERLSPLTEAMEREVAAAFGPGEPDEILSSAFKLNITREDICTLRHLRWLNDEVINFYLMLLSERSKKTGYPAIHVFSTFFYTKLVSGGYQIVRRWTRSIDLFKQDIVLVPVHLRAHWALVAIDMRKKTIRYFDSFGQNGGEICATLFQYLQEEHREKRRLDLPPSEWTLHSMEPHEIPQQFNGSDCGVFVCQYANHISRDQPLTFTQSHMPYFRRKMVWEILHQQLL
ncbi:sentrin-specific protease 2 [Leptosomus discolor]